MTFAARRKFRMGSPDDMRAAETGPRILVADDDEAVLVTLSAILAKIDRVTVTAAATFDQALEALRAQRFEVVVTEVTIDQPEDGLTLLRSAQELHPEIAGVVLTGSASLQSAIAALQLGVSNYLVKPCNIDELKLTIRGALERSGRGSPAGEVAAARAAVHEAERSVATAEQRVAGRIAIPLGSLRERIVHLQQRADRLALSEAVRYDIQQVDLAATRVEATVDTLLDQRRRAGLTAGAMRAEVLGPMRSHRG
jgi:DNA-binding NtrC family response regulator